MTIKVGVAPFVQPALTSNGTMGGSSFAVASSTEYESTQAAWKAFSKVSPGWQCSWKGLPAWISWYNPDPLKVTEIQGKNRINEPQWVDGVYDYAVQYSNDNSTWTSLQEGRNNNGDSGGSWTISLTAHSIFAKYWRLLITSTTNDRPIAAIGEITISGVNEGSVPVQSIYVGSTPVQAVYVGSTRVWPAGSYSGLNATGDASSYAFPVSAGTITDGTHTATLAQNSTITLSWPGTSTTPTYVVLGVNGQLSAHTSLTTAPAGFVLYDVSVEPETYGLTPYWSISRDYRWSLKYVGGA